jgi:uncharacterized membrane protein
MPMWLIPMAYVAASIVAGLILPRVEHRWLAIYFEDVSATSALAFLSTIASGMMALTAIVFSIAYITVQFNAVAYSPRLALWLARDRALFHTLGLFMATFIYALEAMNWIDRGNSDRVPLLSCLVVVVLLIVSMFMFTWLVRGLIKMQVTNTLRVIGHRGRGVITEMFTRIDLEPLPPGMVPAERPALGPAIQTVQYDGEPCYLARLGVKELVELARQADAVIEVAYAVGDTVVDDSLLLSVHQAAAPLPEARLRRAIELRAERTFEQDPKYPIRLLVDIAIKALSPAINDPTTAVQAIDQIEDLLRRLGRRELDAGYAWDANGVLRLIFPMPSWEDYLRLAFDEIRLYGAESVQVMRRLRSALASVAETAVDEPRTAMVRRYVKQLDLVIERSTLDAEDRVVASQEDRQGLGVSRKRAPAPAPAPVPVPAARAGAGAGPSGTVAGTAVGRNPAYPSGGEFAMMPASGPVGGEVVR